MAGEGHPIDVNLDRMLPILAKEIYNTPYAFLRENVQNAVDAVRIQVLREKRAGRPSSGHAVRVIVSGNTVSISDTGNGMGRDDLRTYFWSIGQSGKHTEEAKTAGVVGTFGIGGMANFGVCSHLKIETRTEEAPEAVVSQADRANLSASKECVFYSTGNPNASRGTTVIAELMDSITEGDAAHYLEPIVQYMEMPIYVGDTLLSKKPFPRVSRDYGESILAQSGNVTLTVFVTADAKGRAEAEIENIAWRGAPISDARGHFIIGKGAVSAYQHGFMLARVPVSTIFSLEGSVDCSLLRPTAGREALTSDAQSMVQSCIAATERAIAEHIARDPNLADRFSTLFHYIYSHSRWELADLATIRTYGADTRVTLITIREVAAQAEVYYCKDIQDRSIMETYKSQGKTIAILSTEVKRQQVEQQYLTRLCNARLIEDRVMLKRPVNDAELNTREFGFIFALKNKLKFQYFVPNISVKAGELSHNAMLLTPPAKSGAAMVLFVNLNHAQVRRLIEVRHSLGYDAILDVFVRDSVFPHLESAFPDLRKRDFDTLLKRLQSTIEEFQIDPQDIERLKLLAEVTNMPPEKIAQAMGATTFGTPIPATVNESEVVSVSQVVHTPQTPPKPGADIESRREELLATLRTKELEAKILDASGIPEELGIKGYYMGVTPDAHVLYRWVLERRPTIDFSWGGNRTGYLFYEEGSCIVYYDMELHTLVEAEIGEGLSQRVGTLHVDRDPLLCKNMAFLPIPDGFERYFVPRKETLRFTIKHQILGPTDIEFSQGD